MFAHISEKIVSNMEKQHMIQTENKNVYQYGINQMFNMLLNIITFLLIGLIFHMLIETIIFTAAYIPLRIYAGGFHAKTPFRCWIVSAFMLLAVLIFMKFVNIDIVNDILAVIGSVIVLAFSPVEDKNKPLDNMEIHVYKKRCIFVFVIELLLFIAFRFFQIKIISICIEIAWVTLSIMLIAGKIKNYIVPKE